MDGEGKVKIVHCNLLLPLLLASETLDAFDSQMISSIVDAHSDSKYESEIKPDKDAAASAVIVACAKVNLNMQNGYSVQKDTDLVVTNLVAKLLKQVGQL